MKSIIEKILDRIEFKHFLALSVILFSFMVIKWILFKELPASADKFSMQILTGLLAMDGTVLAFFFASTASSQKKDETIKQMAASSSNSSNVAPVILLLLLPLLLFGCSSERKFVKFHDLHPDKATGHCAIWCPVKDSIQERIIYKPGLIKTIKGEDRYVYADCDSAYEAALKEAALLGIKVKVKQVAVKVPDNSIRVDTFYKEKVVFQENTARITAQAYEIEDKGKQATHYQETAIRWKKRCIVADSILGGLALMAGIGLLARKLTA